MDVWHWWNNTDTGNPKQGKKSAPLHTGHHKSQTQWPGIDTGFRGDRPGTNRLPSLKIRWKITRCLYLNTGWIAVEAAANVIGSVLEHNLPGTTLSVVNKQVNYSDGLPTNVTVLFVWTRWVKWTKARTQIDSFWRGAGSMTLRPYII
jgi:hypothetical protein